MKNTNTMRLFIVVTLLVTAFLLACTNEDINDAEYNDNKEPQEEVSVIRTVETAQAELEEFLEQLNTLQTRSGETPKVREIANCLTYKLNTSTRGEAKTDTNSDDANYDVLVYIFNLKNDAGYAIMSGNQNREALLGFIESGNITEETVIESPAAIYVLDRIENYMTGGPIDTIDDGEGNPIYPPVLGAEYSPWEVKHFPSKGKAFVNWGQHHPYNNLAPMHGDDKTLAGCVATATAQLLAFFQYPPSYNGYKFDWSEMSKHMARFEGYRYAPSYSQIARLFQLINLKHNLDMNYGVDGSGTQASNIVRTLSNLGFYNPGQYAEYDTDIALNELKTGYPVVAAGYGKKKVERILGIKVKTTYSNGHVFLLDGVIERTRTVTYLRDFVIINTVEEKQYLVHCNMGWDGLSNGYFFSGIFNAENPQMPSDTRSSGYNFKYKQRMVYGIRK